MRFNSLLFDLLRKPFLYEKQNQNQLVLISSVKSKIYKSNLVYIYIYIYILRQININNVVVCLGLDLI